MRRASQPLDQYLPAPSANGISRPCIARAAHIGELVHIHARHNIRGMIAGEAGGQAKAFPEGHRRVRPAALEPEAALIGHHLRPFYSKCYSQVRGNRPVSCFDSVGPNPDPANMSAPTRSTFPPFDLRIFKFSFLLNRQGNVGIDIVRQAVHGSGHRHSVGL